MPAELATIPASAPRYTGERIARLRPRAYRKAISMLADGRPVNEVAETCNLTWRSVDAIRTNEATSIADRKQSLASIAYRVAHSASEVVENDIAEGRMHGTQAVMAAGVFVDKFMALSDQPTARIKLDVEVHDLSRDFQALHAEIINTMKQANAIEIPSASTVPVPSLTDPAQA